MENKVAQLNVHTVEICIFQRHARRWYDQVTEREF